MDGHLSQMRRYGCVCFQADALGSEGVVGLHHMSFTPVSVPHIAPLPDCSVTRSHFSRRRKSTHRSVATKPTSGGFKADEGKVPAKNIRSTSSVVSGNRHKEEEGREPEALKQSRKVLSKNTAGVSGLCYISAASICLPSTN